MTCVRLVRCRNDVLLGASMRSGRPKSELVFVGDGGWWGDEGWGPVSRGSLK